MDSSLEGTTKEEVRITDLDSNIHLHPLTSHGILQLPARKPGCLVLKPCFASEIEVCLASASNSVCVYLQLFLFRGACGLVVFAAEGFMLAVVLGDFGFGAGT